MTNTNVTKMILGAAFATVAMFSVNANEILPVETNEEVIENVPAVPADSFTLLLSAFDLDENGALSESELSSSSLQLDFSSIDTNSDTNISEDEFNTYIESK
ncbi:hypothetical protein [Colwellia sp. UCD-KL20]|uniref:hypothetical protein n=1 Tax=Colwellia sp. UCD-KL20 TaxID=1917165 RepID=UPI000970431A|nr:hypothetical protein [Colwellia sp. UCD-KL20]